MAIRTYDLYVIRNAARPTGYTQTARLSPGDSGVPANGGAFFSSKAPDVAAQAKALRGYQLLAIGYRL